MSNNDNAYTIKNVKTGPSREYGANGSFTCDLYNGKKKVAAFFEAGDGGPPQYTWLDKADKQSREIIDYLGKPFTLSVTREQGLFLDHISTQKYEFPEGSGEEHSHSEYTYVHALVEAFEEDKRVKRMCAKKTVVVMAGSPKGEYCTFAPKFSQEIKGTLQKKYGNNILEFVNERFTV